MTRSSTGLHSETLPSSFYDRPTLGVAADLVGKVLVHTFRGRRTSGVIVEVEAYIGESDPACHAAPGPTNRNQPLYGPPGHAYVYLNYGLHYLVNAVTEREGFPAAVLIRALEPLEGIHAMRRRRGRPGLAAHMLCSGPGNLTVALGIGPRHNRADLSAGRLTIEDHHRPPRPLAWTPRIGIRVGTVHRWRCIAADSPAVSGPRPSGRLGR
jgi:DNA-3-methyladenine glycosylase